MSTLHDARFAFFASSEANVLAQDRAFVADAFKSALANGSTFSIGVTTGPKAATLPGFSMSDRSDQTEIEFFEGGAYSGGTLLEFFNLNRVANATAVPFTSSFSDVTIDTPGLRIRRATVLGSTNNKNVTTTSDSAGFILKPNTVYYISITNNDGTQAADYDLQLLAAVGE